MLLHLIIIYAHAPLSTLPNFHDVPIELFAFSLAAHVPQAVPASLHPIYVFPPCTRFSDAVFTKPSLIVLCVSPIIVVIHPFL